MKKLLSIILGLFLFCGQIVFANDVDTKQTAEDNKAVISVQKQPANELQKQKITRNIACIIIQVNGKIKENNNTEKAK